MFEGWCKCLTVARIWIHLPLLWECLCKQLLKIGCSTFPDHVSIVFTSRIVSWCPDNMSHFRKLQLCTVYMCSTYTYMYMYSTYMYMYMYSTYMYVHVHVYVDCTLYKYHITVYTMCSRPAVCHTSPFGHESLAYEQTSVSVYPTKLVYMYTTCTCVWYTMNTQVTIWQIQ